jgi:hypothetical protein
MDSLRHHYINQRTQYGSNPAMLGSVITSWFAFDKYYSLLDETGAYTLAALLNPNCRLLYLNSAWDQKWIKKGIERARKVWLTYRKELQEPEIEESEKTYFQRYMADIHSKQRGLKGGGQDEFDRFIHAPPIETEGSALDWWLLSQQQHSFPQLSRLAIDVLSAPAMSAESERVFSGARRSIPWTRASLSARSIERLECLKHWHKAGVVNEEFEDNGHCIDDKNGANPDNNSLADVI